MTYRTDLIKNGEVNELKAKPLTPAQLKTIKAGGPGTNIGGQTRKKVTWPKVGKFIGTGGAGPSVGLIVRIKGGRAIIYHFGTNDKVVATIHEDIKSYRDSVNKGDVTAVVFGSEDEALSKGQFYKALRRMQALLGEENVFVADATQVVIDHNGDFYVVP
jgi:hypothetical protein